MKAKLRYRECQALVNVGAGQERGRPGGEESILRALPVVGGRARQEPGMAGSLYKQAIPLANPTRKPGEWQAYDIVWTAPTFNDDGSVKTPAYATVFFNGVVVENHFELKGQTLYIGKPFYKAYTSAPIKLQAHGDKSEPISFRNIWIRELN